MSSPPPPLKRGWLKKLTRRGINIIKKSKARYVVIEAGKMKYYEKDLVSGLPPYGDLLRCEMDLVQVLVSKSEENNRIQLCSQNGNKVIIQFATQNSRETLEWFTAFQAHIVYAAKNINGAGVRRMMLSVSEDGGLLSAKMSQFSMKEDASVTSGDTEIKSLKRGVSFSGTIDDDPSIKSSPTKMSSSKSQGPIVRRKLKDNPSVGGKSRSSRSVGSGDKSGFDLNSIADEAEGYAIVPIPGFVIQTKRSLDETVFINVCIPGFVMKTKKPSRDKGFFNVCENSDIQLSPPPTRGGVEVLRNDLSWPHVILSPSRLETEEETPVQGLTSKKNMKLSTKKSSEKLDEVLSDDNGKEMLVYDVIVHPSTLLLVSKDKSGGEVQRLLCERILRRIYATYDGTIEMAYTLPQMQKKYKGKIRTAFVPLGNSSNIEAAAAAEEESPLVAAAYDDSISEITMDSALVSEASRSIGAGVSAGSFQEAQRKLTRSGTSAMGAPIVLSVPFKILRSVGIPTRFKPSLTESTTSNTLAYGTAINVTKCVNDSGIIWYRIGNNEWIPEKLSNAPSADKIIGIPKKPGQPRGAKISSTKFAPPDDKIGKPPRRVSYSCFATDDDGENNVEMKLTLEIFYDTNSSLRIIRNLSEITELRQVIVKSSDRSLSLAKNLGFPTTPSDFHDMYADMSLLMQYLDEIQNWLTQTVKLVKLKDCQCNEYLDFIAPRANDITLMQEILIAQNSKQ